MLCKVGDQRKAEKPGDGDWSYLPDGFQEDGFPLVGPMSCKYCGLRARPHVWGVSPWSLSKVSCDLWCIGDGAGP